MGCQFSDYYTGKCQLYDGMIKMPVDEEGHCICEDYREQ